MRSGRTYPAGKSLWSVVLAGGEGERLRGLTERWLGYHVPKQYCAFVGTRSMLQHTLERAGKLSTPARSLTLVARSHGQWATEQIDDAFRGGLLHQPINRGTAAGIYFALTHLRFRDPEGMAVFLPSDHFVHPESVFLNAVADLIETARSFGDRLVLLGASPDTLELDYGWIQPGERVGAFPSSCGVRSFLEKPDRKRAFAVRATGALWNTMVMAAPVALLWRLGWIHLPELMPHFSRLERALGTARERDVLDSVYAEMPEADFSSGLLQKATDRLAVLPLEGVLWSDWGRPERIRATLERIGKRPAWLRSASTRAPLYPRRAATERWAPRPA